MTNLLLIFALPLAALPQTSGQFAITQSVTAGGGGTNSTGGAFSLDATIGQAIAGDTSVNGSTSLASGFWTVNPFAGQGFEADVAPRNAGDGVVLSNDVIQIQRFQIGLDQPDQANELQRADSAPFASRGDEIVQSNDVVQAQRYQIGLDALQSAAGPSGFAALAENQSSASADHKTNTIENPSVETTTKTEGSNPDLGGLPRNLQIQDTSGGVGQQVVVNVLVDAVGDESAYGFTLLFNPAIFTNPTTAIGTAGGSRLCNTNVAGRISCSIINFPNNNPTSSTDQIGEILPGNNQQLLRVTFTIAATAPAGAVTIAFSNVNTSNDAAANLQISSRSGTITVIGATAAEVTVAGRVLTAGGRGLRNATVTMTDANGNARSTRANAFGYFRFDEVAAGQTYVFQVSAKGYTFAPQVVTVNDEITDLSVTAQTPADF